jgi:hypothetical protein
MTEIGLVFLLPIVGTLAFIYVWEMVMDIVLGVVEMVKEVFR